MYAQQVRLEQASQCLKMVHTFAYNIQIGPQKLERLIISQVCGLYYS